jgi:hypothetical protein
MKIYCAKYDSLNFSFEGYGSTQNQAKKTLMLALKLHTKQYKCDKDWYYKDDIFVVEYELGKPYRDYSEIKESA